MTRPCCTFPLWVHGRGWVHTCRHHCGQTLLPYPFPTPAPERRAS